MFVLFPLLTISDSFAVFFDNKTIISGFASKNINFVSQIFHKNGKTKSWDYVEPEYNLERELKYR